MEKVRYQRTSQRQDRLWAIEQKLEEMSQKMDRYFQERNILIPSVIEATEDVNLGQDLSKENSPAITTSMDNIPQQHDFLTTSHAALQLVDSYTSPSNADMHQEPQHITISSIPLHWRKPVMPLHKIEQIGVAQRAVDNLMQYITGKNELAKPGDHQAADAWAILAIHSTLVPFSKRRKNKVEQAIVAQCPSRQSRDESTTKDQLKWGILEFSLRWGFCV
ncbi:hypothetical protein FRC03_011616 [Tulasnella sp. 419]|nr:hypothetical protein FRC03_011616 [Tulasnella sp. 419]